MTATVHAMVGGAIATTTISNPALGMTIAFVSHPLLDIIPHWDFGWGWQKKTRIKFFLQSSADLLLGWGLAYVIFGQRVEFWYLAICILLSESWDILEAPYWFLSWRFPPFSWVYNIQSKIQGKAKLPWGIITQVATLIGLLLLTSGRIKLALI